MKKLILVITFLAVTGISYCQTNTFPASGYVGIGTTGPTRQLEIVSGPGVGPLKVSGPNGYLLIDNVGSGQSYYQANSLHQFQGSSGTPLMTILNSGNVGIGTTSPAYLLDANGVIHSSVTAGSNLIISKNTGASVSFDNGAGVQTSLIEAGASDNHLEFWTNTATNSGLVERMRITNTGSLCIGTTDPKTYMLAVNGSAIATSMTVKLNTNWPDYVFKREYQLPSLKEVKTYIDQNHHLRDMPSEQEVLKDGINLGEMNKLLTKKVEELTLYLILQKEEADNQIAAQQKALEIQQKQINQLNERLNSLTNSRN